MTPQVGTFLILQHTDSTDPNSSLQWLNSNGIKYTLLRSQVLPHLSEKDFPQFDHLITLGGSMNVDEEAIHPWLRLEKKLIEKTLKQKKKVLGLCLGAQLIADVLGSKVEKHKHWEVGWHEIQINPSHKYLQFSPEKILAFQYHQYHFQVPKGAFQFATNHITPAQGYVYENIALGTQFHPESTKPWIQYCATEPVQGQHCQTKDEILSLLHHQEDLQRWYFNLLNSFFLKP